MIFTEIKRILKRKNLYFAIIIGVILGCIGLISYNQNAFFHKAVGNDDAISAFDAWVYTLGVSQTSILDIVIALIICIPYVDSYLFDKKTGYINFLLIRSDFKKYMYSKIISTVVTGSGVAFSIYLILFIICSIFYPLNQPDSDLNYIPYGLFENIYMTYPFLFVIVILLLVSIFGGIFALLGFSSSVFLNNKFAVTAYPFIFFLIFMVIGQIFNIKFLLPVIMVAPFTIIGVSILDIIISYLLIIILTIFQLKLLVKKEKGEIY